MRRNWDGDVFRAGRDFVDGRGAGTTYPDYKPRPFIFSQEVEGRDMITVVTEVFFSYCGFKVKIDTDRHIGDGTRPWCGQAGRGDRPTFMTSEYGSKICPWAGSNTDRRPPERRPASLGDSAAAPVATVKPSRSQIDRRLTMVVEAGQSAYHQRPHLKS